MECQHTLVYASPFNEGCLAPIDNPVDDRGQSSRICFGIEFINKVYKSYRTELLDCVRPFNLWNQR
jgi:hypothetical protein